MKINTTLKKQEPLNQKGFYTKRTFIKKILHAQH